ncbi:uncharacterized protein EI90DRAFT_3015466 [Cantharellus anzutake]|uniref:uncharacterized protein n=1 Tax=Cantharellus anzutake TaxID=1750568 RepID=UPI0019067B00|nr:uncharacterized protein EI90DRAFT_3015466 [Cantharellus anzutake]KAF8333627.1 hypothetical protein EI90DRAFT_3015466 [Cantharellus anzutake]
MKGQTLLSGYFSVSPRSSPPHSPAIEIEDDPPPVGNKDFPPQIPASTKLLGHTRLRTAKEIACTATESDESDIDSEMDEEVDELIQGDEAGPRVMEGIKDWKVLRDQIDKMLEKQKRRVTMRLSEIQRYTMLWQYGNLRVKGFSAVDASALLANTYHVHAGIWFARRLCMLA